MYRKDGQAELFTYPLDGDVAEARSLRGDKKYGDQPYAFRYRKSYSSSCARQLTAESRRLRKDTLRPASSGPGGNRGFRSASAGASASAAAERLGRPGDVGQQAWSFLAGASVPP